MRENRKIPQTLHTVDEVVVSDAIAQMIPFNRHPKVLGLAAATIHDNRDCEKMNIHRVFVLCWYPVTSKTLHLEILISN